MADERELLREAARRLLGSDKELASQLNLLKGLTGRRELEPAVKSVQERVGGGLEAMGADQDLALETIVLRVGRPVLEVRNDDYVVEGPEVSTWQERLANTTVRTVLRNVIPSVGRIEVDHHPDLTWVGTGWLIAEDIVVTNRHVASEFATLSITDAGRAFVFKRGWPDRETRMASRVDFRRELTNSNPRAFQVRDVLHIEDDDGLDFAFLKVEKSGTAGSSLSPYLHTSDGPAQASQYIATVGFPAADSRIPEQDLMSRLFGDKYNVKRLAPGQVMRLADELVMHDCSTLGGNSGSPIVDLASGEVLGLHFSGVFLQENRGVPIGLVVSRLKNLGKIKPQTPPAGPIATSAGGTTPVPDHPAPSGPLPQTQAGPISTMTWTIPLQISVTLGNPIGGLPGLVAATATTGALVAAGPGPTIDDAVAQARTAVKGRSEVMTVRDGFVVRNDWITSDPAVVVVLKGGVAATAESLGLPAQLRGYPVDVRPASPWDIAAAEGVLDTLEGIPRTTYTKPQGLKLEEVNEKMSVICHVSPDAGWPVLSEFLQETKTGLTVGMYDFTAPHIIDGVLSAVEQDPRKLTLVLQSGQALTGKKADIPEDQTIAKYEKDLEDRFDYAPASIGAGHQFASAYHIKVAVRDGKAFWLSSGNWQSSNQPDHGLAFGETSWELLMQHNREWHAVIENSKLSKQFEQYIKYDLKNARADEAREAVALPSELFLVEEAVLERVPAGKPTYFKPLELNRKVRVRPLLTPDNYQEHVLALIQTAKKRLLFQNQSLSLLAPGKNDARFEELVDALLQKQEAGVDVRIIIRGEFAPVGPLEQLQKKGFEMKNVRLQNRCHTKGIIIDGLRVMIGSHNWTNQGTLVNRDASLIFEDEEIAAYFEKIFEFDWEHMARQSLGTRRVRQARAGEEAPAGTRLVSWQEIVYG
jgi:hypothetical protein